MPHRAEARGPSIKSARSSKVESLTSRMHQETGRRSLLAGGQNSNTVSVFAIDQATGLLKFTGTKIDCPAPVSVVFGRP